MSSTSLSPRPGVSLRMMTIAPERHGALAAIAQLRSAGVIAAIGHTDATFDQAREAIAAGATVATHLGNAMSPLHHRNPGVVGACLGAYEVSCELIVDGHHLHPAFVRHAAASKGARAIVSITDAMAAAGVGDGRYRLGGSTSTSATGRRRWPRGVRSPVAR